MSGRISIVLNDWQLGLGIKVQINRGIFQWKQEIIGRSQFLIGHQKIESFNRKGELLADKTWLNTQKPST